MFTATLPKSAQSSLAILGKTGVLPKGSYLAGGSGLALHFGHRTSIDFDFFTPNHFSQRRLAEKLAQVGTFAVNQIAPDTLLGTFERTKFSIFRYNYPLLSKPFKLWGVSIAQPEDIGAMKIVAIMERGTKKDFVDLYFLANQAGITLDQTLTNYDKKYQKLASNIYSIVRSLSYFDDAETSDMPQMLKKVSWTKIKDFFQKEALRLTHAKLGI